MFSSGTADWPPEELWRCFRNPLPENIQQIPAGWSPARLFHVQNSNGNWALKSFPDLPGFNEKRLGFHRILRIASGIVPDCIPSLPPVALVDFGGRVWELLPWIEGEHKSWRELSSQHWGRMALFLRRVHEALKAAGAKTWAPLVQVQSFQNRSHVLKLAWGELNGGPLVWPEPFLAHPAWPLVLPRLKEMVRWALEDLVREEKKVVRIHWIHGDPHLGNWLWREDLPVGLIDFLGPWDCIESDIARLSASHGLDPFETCRLVCLEYGKVEKAVQFPKVGVALSMVFSGLLAKMFRWRNWLLEGRVPMPDAVARLNEILDQISKAFYWRQRPNWPNGD